MNAPAPIIGGMNCPPVEATASMPPASSGLYPTFFITGIVNVPVATTLATELPEIDPKNALARTATFAGPPVHLPVAAHAMSMKKSPAPDFCRNAPKMI